MEKRFRLKKEAVQFFSEKLATAIGDYRFWKVYNVDDNALEEVEAEIDHEIERVRDMGYTQQKPKERNLFSPTT